MNMAMTEPQLNASMDLPTRPDQVDAPPSSQAGSTLDQVQQGMLHVPSSQPLQSTGAFAKAVQDFGQHRRPDCGSNPYAPKANLLKAGLSQGYPPFEAVDFPNEVTALAWFRQYHDLERASSLRMASSASGIIAFKESASICAQRLYRAMVDGAFCNSGTNNPAYKRWVQDPSNDPKYIVACCYKIHDLVVQMYEHPERMAIPYMHDRAWQYRDDYCCSISRRFQNIILLLTLRKTACEDVISGEQSRLQIVNHPVAYYQSKLEYQRGNKFRSEALQEYMQNRKRNASEVQDADDILSQEDTQPARKKARVAIEDEKVVLDRPFQLVVGAEVASQPENDKGDITQPAVYQSGIIQHDIDQYGIDQAGIDQPEIDQPKVESAELELGYDLGVFSGRAWNDSTQEMPAEDHAQMPPQYPASNSDGHDLHSASSD